MSGAVHGIESLDGSRQIDVAKAGRKTGLSAMANLAPRPRHGQHEKHAIPVSRTPLFTEIIGPVDWLD
jgi:hypothetical protein